MQSMLDKENDFISLTDIHNLLVYSSRIVDFQRLIIKPNISA